MANLWLCADIEALAAAGVIDLSTFLSVHSGFQILPQLFLVSLMDMSEEHSSSTLTVPR